jgi:hypothetical protein
MTGAMKLRSPIHASINVEWLITTDGQMWIAVAEAQLASRAVRKGRSSQVGTIATI